MNYEANIMDIRDDTRFEDYYDFIKEGIITKEYALKKLGGLGEAFQIWIEHHESEQKESLFTRPIKRQAGIFCQLVFFLIDMPGNIPPVILEQQAAAALIIINQGNSNCTKLRTVSPSQCLFTYYY